jgi:hypothetical protein
MQKLYESSYYCTRDENCLTLEDFIEDDKVEYDFAIMEIDLDLLKTSELQIPLYSQQKPPHVRYEYDFQGELLRRNWVYYQEHFEQGGWPYYFDLSWETSIWRQNREGDDLPEAGTKFKVGDFVRLRRPMRERHYQHRRADTEQVFVVRYTPRRDDKGQLLENTYQLETVTERGEHLSTYDLTFDYPCQGIHESELVLHDDKVAVDSPLHFLRRIFLGEFVEAWKINREVVFTPTRTLGDIPELAALFEEELA